MYSFFTFDAGDIASTTEHIATLFNDLKPLIFLIVGLMIGFYILGSLIKAFAIRRMDRSWRA